MPSADPEDAGRRCRRLFAHAARPDALPLVMLTAYDSISAAIAHAAGVDLILVGDSAATTILGYTSTRDVTIDEMLMLTRAARRGAPDACLVGDLPFGSYEQSDSQATETAHRFIDAGADMVKLEGAGAMTARVRAIAAAGIAVVGHVGLLPQGARTMADMKARGRNAEEALGIVRDALAVESAGASMLVVEAVPAAVAAAIAAAATIPVIGIGAGPSVGGQVLVYPDLLGLTEGKLPRFVRQYATLRAGWTDAVRAFAADVRSRTFPAAAEEYGMPDDEAAEFQRRLPEVAVRRTR